MYAVVDGKQRLLTAVAWFCGDLLVPASWFDPEEVEATTDTSDGAYVAFTGLNLIGQRRFSNRAMLPVIEAKVSSVQAEADLFLLVNGGGTPRARLTCPTPPASPHRPPEPTEGPAPTGPHCRGHTAVGGVVGVLCR